MHECFGFGATNTATPIRAFVAKNLDTKSIAPYIPAWGLQPQPQPFVHSWLNPQHKRPNPIFSYLNAYSHNHSCLPV
jgi:hypothetical protein